MLAMVSLWALRRLKNGIPAFYLLLATTIGIYSVAPLYMPLFQRLNGQHVSEVLNQYPKPLSVFCAYECFNDLPFYLKQPVGIIDSVPNEHELGYNTEGCNRYVDMQTFHQRWQQETPCYAVVRVEDIERFERNMQPHAIYRLTKDPFFALYCNQLCPP
jgi:hypothetical protein